MTVRSTTALPCLCANLRRASRAITQRYEQALRPMNMTVTHFTILQALSLTGEILQGRLGEILVMDSTTLTRTLGIVKGRGWITIRRGTDRRERWLSLSKQGKAEFKQALPHWEAAQARLRTELGDGRWNSLMKLINETTSVVAD